MSRPIRLAYDHQIFAWQKYGGISRYIYELATRMTTMPGFDVHVVAPLYVNEYLKAKESLAVRGKCVRGIGRAGRLLRAATNPMAKRVLRTLAPDIVHETYYAKATVAPPTARTVVTVHDMIQERFPECFKAWDDVAESKAIAVRRADHVICVSESTKRDLMDILGVQADKISVIHHGVLTPACGNTEAPALPPGRPYILFVGNRGCYKNFDGLLDAYCESARLRGDFRLICFGGGQFTAAESGRLSERGIPQEDAVYVSGNDHTLADLYRHAAVFVYPSKYEGFGLPVLEAMSLGCPVVCGHTSSLPEVAGDAVEYFDAQQTASLATAIENVVYSPDRRQDLVSRGGERVKRFSWDRCAAQTAAVYARLAR